MILLALAAAAPVAYAFANYGTISPCAILHQNVRAALLEVVDNPSSPALARGITNTLLAMLPIDTLVDAALTRKLGSAGPLQCLEALASGFPNKTEWRHKLNEAQPQ
jgi:hypothetical protein